MPHALFDCPDIAYIWKQQLTHFCLVEPGRGVAETVKEIQVKGTTNDVEILFIIAWGMWHWRNEIVFESMVLVHPHAALRWALSLHSNYKAARERKNDPSVSQKTWKAPDLGELKLKVDGAIFVKRN